jgi:hypothetical protein
MASRVVSLIIYFIVRQQSVQIHFADAVEFRLAISDREAYRPVCIYIEQIWNADPNLSAPIESAPIQLIPLLFPSSLLATNKYNQRKRHASKTVFLNRGLFNIHAYPRLISEEWEKEKGKDWLRRQIEKKHSHIVKEKTAYRPHQRREKKGSVKFYQRCIWQIDTELRSTCTRI